ncbi:MAG: pyridoxamine 5'-phosphate oxidase family protein [Rhodobacteraceae bacterium]|nr:pyridoxamine 5'-phosphate oxidase family protein [Paracoccaceae bacterium]
MKVIETLDALTAVYGEVSPRSLDKVVTAMTPLYRKWIEASKFCVLTTVGDEGTDGSPRGDDGPVVRIADAHTLMLPDWRGNNRLDSLRNIVTDGRVSLMFMVPGDTNVVRVNGTAVLTDDPAVTHSFEQKGRHPRTVIVITIGEMYFQCAKAVMRSQLWGETPRPEGHPTAGDFVCEVDESFDGKAYDDGYAEYAKPRMW